MSAPWEDTIVMALRDAQWIDGEVEPRQAPAFPALFIKMDGDTEKALGDVMLDVGERLYLLEVKASSNEIKTEWNKSREGEYKPKASFESLRLLMEAENANLGAYEAAYRLSLACHHLVYWSDIVFDDSDTFGNIMVEPYILACTSRDARGFGRRCDGFTYEVAEDVGSEAMLVGSSVALSALRKQSACVIKRNAADPDDEGVEVTSLGADRAPFLAYLAFLLEHGGGGQGELNAVIYSDKGKFFRNIKSISDLRRTLDGTNKLGLAPEQKKIPTMQREKRTPERAANATNVIPEFPPLIPTSSPSSKPSPF